MATKKPTTKKGLNVAMPNGDTYNTATKKVTPKTVSIPAPKPANDKAKLAKAQKDLNAKREAYAKANNGFWPNW